MNIYWSFDCQLTIQLVHSWCTVILVFPLCILSQGIVPTVKGQIPAPSQSSLERPSQRFVPVSYVILSPVELAVNVSITPAMALPLSIDRCLLSAWGRLRTPCAVQGLSLYLALILLFHCLPIYIIKTLTKYFLPRTLRVFHLLTAPYWCVSETVMVAIIGPWMLLREEFGDSCCHKLCYLLFFFKTKIPYRNNCCQEGLLWLMVQRDCWSFSWHRTV